MGITLDEAKALMTPDSIDKLKNFVNTRPNINMENKVNCDILIQALCRAVTEDIIHISSLDDKLVKLLNSATNTLSQTKLGDMLSRIRVSQPNIVCCVMLKNQDMTETLHEWVFTGPEVKFNGIFETVVEEFDITPSTVRNKMVNTLKPTIVNNIAQLLTRYQSSDSRDEFKISINTITRLVNMENHLLLAEFKDMK